MISSKDLSRLTMAILETFLLRLAAIKCLNFSAEFLQVSAAKFDQHSWSALPNCSNIRMHICIHKSIHRKPKIFHQEYEIFGGS